MNKTCWILGSKSGKNSNEYVKEMIAHEMGHVFVGYGHPDAPIAEDRGPAPLPGTEKEMGARLMCRGRASSAKSRLLVKGEWDEAEKWLKINID